MRMIALLLIAGCTSIPTYTDERGCEWELENPPINNINVTVVHDGNIFLHCMFMEKAEACSVRRVNECDIYIPFEGDAYLLQHERRHCEGWTHGKCRW